MGKSWLLTCALAIGGGLTGCSTSVNDGSVSIPPTTTVPSGTAAPGASSKGAEHLLGATLRNARSQRSLHYVSTTKTSTINLTITGDVTKSLGWQTLVNRGGSTPWVAEVRLVHREAYMRGDVAALKNFFGFTASAAARYAGRWISVVPTDSYYEAAAAALTVSSVIDEIALGKPVSSGGHVTVGGRTLQQVRGSLAAPAARRSTGSAMLTITASSDPLPVRYSDTFKNTTSGSDSTVLSRWGETVHVVAPATSTPLATITGGGTTTTQPPIAV